MAEWNLACSDWEKRLSERASLVPALPLDPEKAQQAVQVFNNLRLPDVLGFPRLEEAAGDWFRDAVAALFGSLDDEGVRHVWEVFLLVVKKSSKTTNSAALMLTALILNERPLADFLLIGPTQQIAERAFTQAQGMIKADPEGFLQKRFKVQNHIRTIEDLTTGAKLRVKTFSMDVLTGVIPIGVLLDEVHLLGEVHYAESVIEQIRGGLAAKPERFLVMITTQSVKPPAGVFKKELKYARGVRDGKIAGSHVGMLPVLYEFPPALQLDKKQPWANPKLWPMVMPNLGRSFQLQPLIGEFENAKEKGEDNVRRWATQHLNIEIGMAMSDDDWAGADNWPSCANSALTFEDMLERCEVLVAAIDNGGSDDLFGFTVAGREKETGAWLFWTRGFALETVLKRRPGIASKLTDFAREGSLTLCGKGSEIIRIVCGYLKRILASGLFPEKAGVGVDSGHYGVIVDELARIDIADPLLVAVNPQAWSMNSAIEAVDWKLVERAVEHDGSGLMAWCVSNAKVEKRKNMKLITKEVSGAAKIDPLVSALIAGKLLEANPQAHKPQSQKLILSLGKRSHAASHT